MDNRMKPSSGCDEDLCDTCSGDNDDTDDTCSVRSWKTDQGDDFSSVSFSQDYAPHVRQCSDWDNSVINNAPHGGPSDAMPMCYGYPVVPSNAIVIPMCYVIMPTVETTVPWENSNTFQCDGLPKNRGLIAKKDSKKRSGQARHDAGTWAKPQLPAFPRAQETTGSIRGALKGCSLHQRAPAKMSSAASHPERKGSCGAEATTVILRNLPIETTRDMLLATLDAEGFSGGYDFVHLPVDFQTRSGLGYALVNLVSHNVALRVHRHFAGFTNWPWPSDAVCEVAWNSPHQGLVTHIERYRNSPLMHSSVPEAYRPLVFVDGVRAEFPAPTNRIRAPRIRHQKPDGSLKGRSANTHDWAEMQRNDYLKV